MPVKEEDLQSRVTIEATIRFEKRADVNVFQLVQQSIDAVQKADPEATVDMYQAIKPTLQSTERMSSFIYECCFTPEMREAASYDDFVKDTQWMELASLFDYAYLALFTFSQDQMEPKKTVLKPSAKAEILPPA